MWQVVGLGGAVGGRVRIFHKVRFEPRCGCCFSTAAAELLEVPEPSGGLLGELEIAETGSTRISVEFGAISVFIPT